MAIPSPCTGLCSFERRTGYCIGCARTSGEIVGWRAADDHARERVVRQLAARRTRIGSVRRLSWGLDDIKAFVLASFDGDGTWVSGVHGAIGAFRRGGGEDIAVSIVENVVSARAMQAAISFKLSAKVRAYSVDLSGEDAACDRSPAEALSDFVVMAVSRSSGLTDDRGLTRLGADADAILGDGREETLYDFGLGCSAASFGVRTADRGLEESLARHLGDRWPTFFPALSDEMIRAAPTRIVRSPLGRVEVSTPTWSGSAAGGPYTQFLPPSLTLLDNAEPAGDIADSYLPCAVHYPA